MNDSVRQVIGGRYQLVASIGKGGMGVVYKAYDPVLDRLVALKKMVATVVDSDELRQRFYIEARAAARLNHPNIVTIHELEEYAGDIYIVMELLDGVSLARFLEPRVPMSLAGLLTILAQAAQGLHYAHARDIVHRDVKPANLILTVDGGVKVLDFGIAQLASHEITQTGAMLGTPHYMAPEQIRGEQVDARADLFALGAVAYELMTGRRAFTADTVAAVLMRIANVPHTPVREAAPDASPALAALVDRLLSKDREARPASGAALCQALEQIGEIDRVDLVAEAVRTVLGPLAEDTLALRRRDPSSRQAVVTDASSPTTVGWRTAPPPPAPPRHARPPTARDGRDTRQTTPMGASPPPLPPGLAPATPATPVPSAKSTTPAATPMPQPLISGAAVPSASAPAQARPVDADGRHAVGIPVARTRRGSGVTLLAIAALMLLAFGGTGWWWYFGQRSAPAPADSATASGLTADGRLAEGTSTPRAPSTSTSPPTPASAAAPPPLTSTAMPMGSSIVASAPQSRAVAAALAARTPSASNTRAREAARRNPASSTRSAAGAGLVNSLAASDGSSPQSSRPAVPPPPPPTPTKEPAPEAPREATPSSEPTTTSESTAAAAARQPLDPSSLTVFQGPGRSPSSASDVYAESTSRSQAAAVARITYALESYGRAIAQHDLDALRDVRSPITSAEAALLKEPQTTVRFTNLDVSVDGAEGLVRCRRSVVTAGKTRSNDFVEVRLTRRPAGWIITEIK